MYVGIYRERQMIGYRLVDDKIDMYVIYMSHIHIYHVIHICLTYTDNNSCTNIFKFKITLKI